MTNVKNCLPLTIRTLSLNLVAKRPVLIAKLRKLTLAPNSGSNFELNRMLKDAKYRKVNCKIILAYQNRNIIAWSLLSKENSNFTFCETLSNFKKEYGWMFQVFVNIDHRRQGVASKLYKVAQKKIGKEVICICPWDEVSRAFYNKFPEVNRKSL